jgi:hypothetical protein
MSGETFYQPKQPITTQTMKKTLATILLIIACVSLNAYGQEPPPIPDSAPVVLGWDYPESTDTTLGFVLLHSTTTNTAMTNWTRLATAGREARKIEVTVARGVNYFSMIATNFWWDSDPSNVTNTPELTVKMGDFKVKKGGGKGVVELTWSYPVTADGSLSFEVYHSASSSVPIAQWAVIATAEGTARAVNLTVTPGSNFFVARAKNFWGYGPFSEVASTPDLPAAIQGDLTLQLK